MSQAHPETDAQAPAKPWLDVVRGRAEQMKFGSIQIVIHEGRVTQVDATERTRLPRP